MIESPHPPSLHHQIDPPVSSKPNSGERDGVLTKNIGFPLRLLLRELDTSIPPIPEPERKLDSPENPAKSPERDGPTGYTEGFSGKPAENHVAAMGTGGRGKVLRMESGVVRRAALRKTEVGIRVSEVVLCVVSFSVMAGNKTGGWAGDYFDRYQEYRYCFSVNVIASAYSMFQLYSQLHHRIWKSHIISHPISYSFEFLMDQVLAYLLMSASSAAASCNDDWVSMFGSDKFTSLMVISITMSFFAFSAFSISSIISAYKLFSRNP